MKKNILLAFLFLSVFNSAFSQNSEALREQAMQLFDEGKFTESLASFEKIRDKEMLENTNINMWKEHILEIQKLKFEPKKELTATIRIVLFKTGLLFHYGVYDDSKKQFIILPVYDKIDFQNGYFQSDFQVHKGNKAGLCNLQGNFVVPMRYHTITSLYDIKLINVKQFNAVEPSEELKSFVYDFQGKMVIDNAEIVDRYTKNLIIIKNNKNLFQLYDVDNNKIVLENCSEIKNIPYDYSKKYDFLMVTKDNQSFYFYPKTNLLQPNTDFDRIINLGEEHNSQFHLVYYLKTRKGKKIESKGKTQAVTSSDLKKIKEKGNEEENGEKVNQEYADYFLVKKNNKTGVYDMNLKKYVEIPIYDSISPQANCLKDGKWSNLIQKEMIWKVFYAQSSKEWSNNSKILQMFVQDNKYGLKDESSKVLLKPEYDEMYFYWPVLIFRKDKLWGFLGNNNSIVEPKFDYISVNGGIIKTYLNGKWEEYFYDSKRKKYCIYKPKKEKNDEVEDKPSKGDLKKNDPNFVEYSDFDFDGDDDENVGRKEIKKGNLYGIANLNNKEIVPPIYKSIFVLGKNFMVRNINDIASLIDRNGKEIIPFIYNGMDSFYNGADSYDDKLYKVYSGSKNGIFSIEENKEIVPLLYSSIEPITNDLFIVRDDQHFYGVIDKWNKIIYPFVIKTFDRNIVKVSSHDFFICSGVSDSNFSFSSLIRITNGKATNMFDGYELSGTFTRTTRKIALVKKDGLISLYDLRKASFVGPQFKESIYIQENDSYLLKKDSSFDYQLDMFGNLTKRTKPIVSTWKGYSIYEENKVMGLINEKGETSKASFPKILYLGYNPYPKTLFRYYSDLTSERNGLIDFDGNIIVKADKYDEIKPLSEIDLSFPDNKFTADEIKFIFMCTDKSNPDYNEIDYISFSGKKIAHLKIAQEFKWTYMRNKNGLLVFKSKEDLQIFNLKTNKIVLKTKSAFIDGNETSNIISNIYFSDQKSGKKERRIQLINNNGNIVADESYSPADERDDHKKYGSSKTKTWMNPLITVKNNKYGFITFDEKIIHPFVYDTISYIKNRVWYHNYFFLEVGKNNKKGILDNIGRILLDFKYDKLKWVNLFENKGERDDERERSSETFAIIVKEKGKCGLLNSGLNPILPTEFDAIRIDGKIITSPIIARKKGYSIVFDSKGSYQFKVECDSLRENLKLEYFEIFKDGKQGVLDYKGNLILDFIYPNVQKIEIDNLFLIQKDTDEYLVDSQGKILSDGFKKIKTIPYKWENYQKRYYYILTKDHNNKVGLIDKKLKVMIPNEYDSIEYIIDSKYIHAKKDGKYGVLDLSNTIVIPFKYTDRIHYNEDRRYFDCEIDNSNFTISPQNVILKEDRNARHNYNYY
jgi:hypothetical protein